MSEIETQEEPEEESPTVEVPENFADRIMAAKLLENPREELEIYWLAISNIIEVSLAGQNYFGCSGL